MDRANATESQGLVHPATALDHFRLERHPVEPPLDRVLDRFWRTEWRLAEPFVQSIVTFPVVNFVIQSDGSAVVSGVQRRNDERRLEGAGWALGAMFRPAGFRPFVSTPASAFTDRRLPAHEVFGPAVEALVRDVVADDGGPSAVMALARFLSERLPAQPTVGEELSELIEAAVGDDPPVTRVDDLARRAQVSVRSLQRRFADQVGLSPKLVLERYRVQAAGEAARQPRRWSDEAQRLGYADQAHLTKDLARHYGAPPATYARQEGPDGTSAGADPA